MLNRLQGAPVFEQKAEYDEDFILIHALQPNKEYEFVVVSVDGEYSTESDPRLVETYVTG